MFSYWTKYGIATLLDLTLVLLSLDLSFFENIVDPDQMASNEAI